MVGQNDGSTVNSGPSGCSGPSNKSGPCDSSGPSDSSRPFSSSFSQRSRNPPGPGAIYMNTVKNEQLKFSA
jgi:hypothetical protein